MKRLLVFVFAVVLLGSCRKTRTVHFEGVMTSNTNIYSIVLFSDYDRHYYELRLGEPQNHEIPIPVGEIYRGQNHSELSRYLTSKKGDIINTTLSVYCDSSITTTDTIQCDFEMELGFFVDDVLVEERIISHSGNEIIQNSSVNWSILNKTINFTVP
tara:strand:+ start:186 stop:656 length:471 start_codon:yes stop_codon:yes gene_type:complete